MKKLLLFCCICVATGLLTSLVQTKSLAQDNFASSEIKNIQDTKGWDYSISADGGETTMELGGGLTDEEVLGSFDATWHTHSNSGYHSFSGTLSITFTNNEAVTDSDFVTASVLAYGHEIEGDMATATSTTTFLGDTAQGTANSDAVDMYNDSAYNPGSISAACPPGYGCPFSGSCSGSVDVDD